MDSGLEGTTQRQYLNCVMGADAYWEFSTNSTDVPPEDDYGVGMGALLIQLVRAIFFPDWIGRSSADEGS